MFGRRTVIYLLAALAALVFSGCATSRGIMPLSIPATMEPAEAHEVTVYIGSVTDARVFEERPKSPDIPSLGFGGAAASSDEIKARAIARKRGGFGKAMGDILLPEGQTVASVTGEMVASAMRSAGYKVTDSADTPGTVTVEINIDKFWGWLNMGAWALTVTAHTETGLTAKYPGGEAKSYTIFAKGSHRPQMASTANWQKAFRLMMEDYSVKLGEALVKDPL